MIESYDLTGWDVVYTQDHEVDGSRVYLERWTPVDRLGDSFVPVDERQSRSIRRSRDGRRWVPKPVLELDCDDPSWRSVESAYFEHLARVWDGEAACFIDPDEPALYGLSSRVDPTPGDPSRLPFEFTLDIGLPEPAVVWFRMVDGWATGSCHLVFEIVACAMRPDWHGRQIACEYSDDECHYEAKMSWSDGFVINADSDRTDLPYREGGEPDGTGTPIGGSIIPELDGLGFEFVMVEEAG